MYFQFACQKCGKNLKVREENVGSKVRCPYCHHHQTVEAPDEPDPWDVDVESFEGGVTPPGGAPGTAPAGKKSGRKASKSAAGGSDEWADGTEVGSTKSAAIAAGISVAFYAVMYGLRVALGDGVYFVDLFCDRGWVPFALVFLMSWSGAILFLKSRKVAKQKDSMLFDLLPNDISKDITAKSAREFVKHVRGLPAKPGESFLINRVLRGLEHFRVLRDSSEVAHRLSSQSEIDANAVESSYSMLKVFIWAIPILGFIGTVIGISAAVGGFSGGMADAQDVSALKESLNGVTGGLATAFDTTLVALVMSMLVMFPTSAMQKSEEDLLNWVDEYCNENLLKRLKDGKQDAAANTGGLGDRKALQAAVDAAMANHHAELKTWSKKLESIGSTVTDQVVDGWKKVDEQLQSRHDRNLKQIEKAINTIGEKQQAQTREVRTTQQAITEAQDAQTKKFDEVVAAVQAQVEAMNALAERHGESVIENQNRLHEQMGTAIERFEQALSALADKAESVHSDASESMSRSADSLNGYFDGLRQGLESLNTVLAGLGEKQVVIENPVAVAEPAGRRGWGLFGKRRNGANH